MCWAPKSGEERFYVNLYIRQNKKPNLDKMGFFIMIQYLPDAKSSLGF